MTALTWNYQSPSFSGFNCANPLFISILALASFGLLMVASSSIDFAAATYNDPWYFAKKQGFFLSLGFLAAVCVYMIPTDLWHRTSLLFLFLSFALLLLVLLPGVGKVVNGSRRWLNFGPFGMQASELVKFCLIIFYASYLTRRATLVTSRWAAFFIMVGVIVLTAFLLLLEPDFGSSVIITFTLGVMMFVAGVPVLRFILLAALGLFGASLIVMMSAYRKERLLAFMDPFADPYDGGYQLVQSLIAFGRGDWLGLGLGNSIQKLFFLPDAHTDFIFAIIAEETGLIGVSIFILVFGFFIWQIMRISYRAFNAGKHFGAYLCLGIAAQLSMQAFINMGVASGLLPTKGLTLPLISYGGSSLVVTCAMLALVFRVQSDLAVEANHEQ